VPGLIVCPERLSSLTQRAVAIGALGWLLRVEARFVGCRVPEVFTGSVSYPIGVNLRAGARGTR
jgi:hypothetical protein